MPGTITFRPIEANLTHNTDWLGRMDPYCMFSIGGQKAKSSICKHGGTRPHWGDTVTLQSVGTGAPSVCRLEIMDKDRFRPDDNIAATDIDLAEIQNVGSVSRWYPVYHHRKLAGEILIEAVYDGGQQFVQQSVVIPTTTVITEEVITSAPIQQCCGEQFIGQSYEVPLQSGLVLDQNLAGLQQGQFIQGTSYEQEQFIQNTTYETTNLTGLQTNNIGLLGNNAGLLGTNTGLIGTDAGLISSKVSTLGPNGGFPHGNRSLKGTTNAGYSVRPGYTLGNVEPNPTLQANLDTNGGGLFNKPGRERRAEPYTLSNPGTYGIPHGQTIDTSGHLHPSVNLGKQAPIGQINNPGITGYPDNYSVNSGINQGLVNSGNLGTGLTQSGLNQGQLGGGSNIL